MTLDARIELHGYTPCLATRRDGEKDTQRVIAHRFLVRLLRECRTSRGPTPFSSNRGQGSAALRAVGGM